jgi:spore coat polysaccharide biosynthesis protein SpsF
MSDAIFITARLKSTRLSRKVLRLVNGKVILSYLIDRLKSSLNDIKIILCTSTNPEDDELENFCDINKISCFRGSEEDVLDRYFKCAEEHSIDNIYIIYGDEPLVDINALKTTFDYLKLKKMAFVDNSNLIDGTFGYGLTYAALKYICSQKSSLQNEVWGNFVSTLPITKVIIYYDHLHFDKNSVRLTIDYPEDLIVFEKLVESFGEKIIEVDSESIASLYIENGFWGINGTRAFDYMNRIQNQSI